MRNEPDVIKSVEQIIVHPTERYKMRATTLKAFIKAIRDMPQEKFPVEFAISGSPNGRLESGEDLRELFKSQKEEKERKGYIDFWSVKDAP
jgi:hypothetical protein